MTVFAVGFTRPSPRRAGTRADAQPWIGRSFASVENAVTVTALSLSRRMSLRRLKENPSLIQTLRVSLLNESH